MELRELTFRNSSVYIQAYWWGITTMLLSGEIQYLLLTKTYLYSIHVHYHNDTVKNNHFDNSHSVVLGE